MTCESRAEPTQARVPRLVGSVALACTLGVLQACRGADAVAPASPLAGATPAVPPAAGPAAAVSPRIASVGPDTLVAGGTLVIEGEALGGAQPVRVSLAGIELPVHARSAGRIEVAVPVGVFPCTAAAPQVVQIAVGSASYTGTRVLQPARRVSLAVGESVSLLEAGESRCVELPPAAAGAAPRYVVAVVNTSTTPGELASFELRGTGGGEASAAVAGALRGALATGAPAASVAAGLPAALRRELEQVAHADQVHGALMARQMELVRGARGGTTGTMLVGNGVARTALAGTASARAAPTALARVGDTLTFTAMHSSCAKGQAVRARVVYAGPKALVLEDLAAPRAGTMDLQYRQLGGEFDSVVYPLLVQNIGDPLAMNGRLAGDGRVTMLFTRYVNDSLPGTAAFVNACNFYPRSTFAASNQDEVFYARVAGAWETPAEWRRAMRATVVHEAKHLASFAERLVRGVDFEEPWLEEATARIAEELYSRTFPGGGAWKGNVGFASSVGCEVLQCDDRPLIMWKHFSGLHQYLRSADTLSPLASSGAYDNSYYASGWAFVRWLLDSHATSEAGVLRALVRGETGHVGMAALTALSGQPAAALAAQWASDNLRSSGIGSRMTGVGSSWNLADQWAGVAGLFPSMFEPAPLRVVNGAPMLGGTMRGAQRALGATYFAVSGSDSVGEQAIILQLSGGGNGARQPALVIHRVD